MEQKDFKTYTIEVGIDDPYVGIENTFKIELPLYQNEIDTILKKGIEYQRFDSDLETWDYIQAFTPEVYNRANKLAEEYAVPKWGDKMKIEKGAHYHYFLPDDFCDAIWNSEESVKANTMGCEMQTLSKKRFHEDTDALNEEYNKGRWGNRLLKNPQWNNLLFYGSWTHTLGKLNSMYGLSADVIIRNQKIEVEYSQNYTIDSVELELRLFPTIDILENIIVRIVKDKNYTIKKIVPLECRLPSWVLYAEGKKTESDVEIFKLILDEFVKVE